MATSEFEISSVQFTDQGLVISYLEVPTDVRVNGLVVQTRSLSMSSRHPDYRADAESLHAKAVRVLRNALEDWSESEPWDPDDDPDDDESERGLGE